MTRLIEQTLRSPLTALNFIDRWGAVVQPMTRTYEAAEGAFIRKTFPVSCDVDPENCFEGDKYKQLVPDEAYTSIAYIEQRPGGGASTATGPKRLFIRHEETMRLVVWLNPKRLGLDDCLGVSRYQIAVQAAIRGDHAVSADGYAGRLTVTEMRFVEHDAVAVFGRYSYADMQHLFFWPAGDFFAIEFTALLTLKGCVGPVELGTEIECVTQY